MQRIAYPGTSMRYGSIAVSNQVMSPSDAAAPKSPRPSIDPPARLNCAGQANRHHELGDMGLV